MFAPGAGRVLASVAFVLLLAAALVATGLLPHSAAAYAALGLTAALLAFFAVFFRDPERRPGDGIVSAADGRVREVATEGDRLLVSVFMNVTNVHVNRLPLDATFDRIDTAGSGHRPAYRPDADRNVARRYSLSTALGPVEVVQRTGILARRLVAFVRPGDRRAKGARFGMIVLGSRVDVLLPAARCAAAVKVGDRVRAGTTTIARERT
ncbi:MAG TPA: phosphatidylserine decarboxylase [Thermoplasmata archaeon]|nr:phosphatidylserine decarboxylase [Thermoplasmata archaeon]